MSIQCRTCAERIFNPNAKNLFEQDDNEILHNIEILTGMRLNVEKNLPTHICTCCHLDLYHSIAFRERCIRTEEFLQTGKPKLNLDPLNTPDRSSKLSPKEDYILNKPDSEIISKQSTQRRILRARKPNVSRMLTKNCLRKRKKYSNDSNAVKGSLHESEVLMTSQPSILEQRPSISSEELNNLTAEAGIKQMSPDPSPAEESSVEQIDSTTIKKEKRTVKPNGGEPKVYICDLCGHPSSNPKNLHIHILRHKGEKNFECEECGTKHYSKYLLQLHIRVKHQGEMPFVCRFCGQRFYSASARSRHEQVRHIRSWSYECKVCGKKYLTKSCLNKHEFLHTGLRPYRCDLCNVAFPRKPGLRIHCRTKQHQKRASEALSNPLDDIKELTAPDDAIVFADSIIEELE